ncbi:DUF6477 family protein [Frigidibacter oleivorans]|uniref:DUF6477 family protein n=1 Tax=Frigidibacter oleivorans TaxID=2487129 RepID=UPI00197B03C9|nr:DUF6477 family protein [Frigidibacter oleivorans]
MTDAPVSLARLRRPALLIRAARAGLAEYDRARDLRRLLPRAGQPAPGRALAALVEAEALADADRREGRAGYSVIRHVGLLVALLAEARMGAEPAPSGPVASSSTGTEGRPRLMAV